MLGVSIVVFVTMHLLPGDVAQLLLGDHATNEQLARLRHQLGLDQPVWVQYRALHASGRCAAISAPRSRPTTRRWTTC